MAGTSVLSGVRDSLTLHPAGVVSALLVVATANCAVRQECGSGWAIWPRAKRTARRVRRRLFRTMGQVPAQSPRGLKVGIADEVRGDREMSLTS